MMKRRDHLKKCTEQHCAFKDRTCPVVNEEAMLQKKTQIAMMAKLLKESDWETFETIAEELFDNGCRILPKR